MSTPNTLALHRGAVALADELGEVLVPEHYTEARVVMSAGLEVEELAAAYADAQFGPGGWDDAPAVVRNEIRDRMRQVRASILGES